QLFVGGVVGQEMPEVDVAQAGRRARQRSATASRDADVLGAVFRGNTSPVEPIVEVCDGLPQLPYAGDRRVLLVVDVYRDALHARGRARQRSSLRLPLAEVAPRGIAAAKTALLRLGGDVDDPGARHGAERGENPLFGHGWSI